MSRYTELFQKLHSTTPLTSNSNVLIIDGTNTFIRVFSNVPSLNDNGDHVGGVVGFLRSIGALIRKELPTKCIVVFDGVGGSQRRRKIYPEYKANRKNTTRFNRHDEFRDLIDEQKSMKAQFSRIIQYLDTLPISVVVVDNIEADDSVAYLIEHFRQFNSKITICSSDRDFLQLVTDDVTVWSPIKKLSYTRQLIEKEFGFLSKNYLIYRTLIGDASDNIPGVNGIGLKTMLKRYPEFINSELSVDEFIEITKLKAIEFPKVKIYSTIMESTEKIKLNYQLMQLRVTDISAHAKLNILNKIRDDVTLDKKKFLEMFFEDGLNSMIKDPHTWLHNSYNRLEIYGKS